MFFLKEIGELIKLIRILKRLVYWHADGLVFQSNDALKYFGNRAEFKGKIINNPVYFSNIEKSVDKFSKIIEEVSNNQILQILRDEKTAKISGGLYHELQIRMTYNSNHIEGSKLSEDQTRLIFETSTIDIGDGIPVDDILETVHHFRAIDFCIDIAEEKLTEEIIKKLHFIIKHDTKDSTLSWFSVGDYKKRANVVRGRETSKPSDVSTFVLIL